MNQMHPFQFSPAHTNDIIYDNAHGK